MRKQRDITDTDELEVTDRLAVAFLSAGFGFLTGMIVWLATPRAFDISFSVFLWSSVILAAVFSFIGFISPAFASRSLGNILDAVTIIRRKIFFWIRLIK